MYHSHSCRAICFGAIQYRLLGSPDPMLGPFTFTDVLATACAQAQQHGQLQMQPQGHRGARMAAPGEVIAPVPHAPGADGRV